MRQFQGSALALLGIGMVLLSTWQSITLPPKEEEDPNPYSGIANLKEDDDSAPGEGGDVPPPEQPKSIELLEPPKRENV
jgi:hypothetical protein